MSAGPEALSHEDFAALRSRLAGCVVTHIGSSPEVVECEAAYVTAWVASRRSKSVVAPSGQTLRLRAWGGRSDVPHFSEVLSAPIGHGSRAPV